MIYNVNDPHAKLCNKKQRWNKDKCKCDGKNWLKKKYVIKVYLET